MKTKQIVDWLRDKAARADGHDYRRMLNLAADSLLELEKELREEMYRHDRLQDFEVAEAEELRKAREQNRWIPVTERLPEKGERVLATDGAFVGEMYIDDRSRWRRYNVNDHALFMALDILWWMPMPESPGEDKKV